MDKTLGQHCETDCQLGKRLIVAVVVRGNRRKRYRYLGLWRGSEDCPPPEKKENRVKSRGFKRSRFRLTLKSVFSFFSSG
jgi:hypothetical protein